MFDKNAPAENINVLTDYLKKNHKDCYVYRGQTTDYDTLLPSFYRNKLKSFRLESFNNAIDLIILFITTLLMIAKEIKLKE